MKRMKLKVAGWIHRYGKVFDIGFDWLVEGTNDWHAGSLSTGTKVGSIELTHRHLARYSWCSILLGMWRWRESFERALCT